MFGSRRGFAVIAAVLVLSSLGSLPCAADVAAEESNLSTTSSAHELVPVATVGEYAGLPLHLPVTDKKPWTSTDFNNDPKNFQFLIVTDRTGGMRHGVFSRAVDKINILQPEFVISVGDLIQGYTKNRPELIRQWDEFDSLVTRLKMPFFYVPGNHDVSNNVMTRLWHERYGPTYYHFLYGNVLFLCLNSEDPESTLSPRQIDYFRQVLEQHTDVRHTMVFVHRPLWLDTEAGKQPGRLGGPYKPRGWDPMEKILGDRAYTVFAGHVHKYTSFIRNDKRYFTLGTTGGGSAMRGAPGFGEFDHVTWVTMTDDGPILSHLDINGIWDENVRTEEVTAVVQPFLRNGIQAETVVTDPFPFTTASVALRLQNDSNVIATIKLQPPPGLVRWSPGTQEITVQPNSVEFTTFTLAGDQLAPDAHLPALPIRWETTFALEDKPAVTISDDIRINLDARRRILPAVAEHHTDGQLSDWDDALGEVERFFKVEGHRPAYEGPKDASFRMAAQHDQRNIYFAFEVSDEYLDPSEDSGNLKNGDCLELQFDLGEDKPRNKLVLLASPGSDETTGTVNFVRGGKAVQAAVDKIDGGYAVEVTIPVSRMTNAENWKRIRLNATLHDRDKNREPGKTVLQWKPGWKSPQNYLGSGEFVRVD